MTQKEKVRKKGINGRLLHPGCGGESLPFWLKDTVETRLDIDPQWNPHILASILDMGDIGSYDYIYTSHTLEHVYPHEVPIALGEFRRVLRDGGAAMIFVPDLEGILPNNDVLYESHGGTVCGLDLFYGHSRLIQDVSVYMAHHTGFVKETLAEALIGAGFRNVTVKRVGDHNLMGVGIK